MQANLEQTIQHVSGFKAAGVYCGLKKDPSRLDFALIVSETPCRAAGVFTTNQVKAAPVLVDMEHLKTHAASIRAVAINSGGANACTGQQGMDNAVETARAVAQKISCDEREVLVMSTGVIGAQLDMAKVRHGVDLAAGALANDWESAARAIMTTDTRPKIASIQVKTANGEYTIAGIAKGAGMIAPNMATMLSLVVTDAALTLEQTQSALKKVNEISYNCIVVDGDTSTNDTVLLLANGQSGVSLRTPEDLTQFQKALEQVCVFLAQAVVRDGEGVTKFMTIQVGGTPDNDSARRIAHTIATSPLVKTAFYGQDANWGRIVAAAGRAGVPIQPDRLSVWLANGSTPLALMLNGVPCPNEEQASAIMKTSEITISLTVGDGRGEATIWTCDLSHEYVSINADYRT